MAILIVSPFLISGEGPGFDEDFLKIFQYRSIGPSRQGGRVVDIAVSPAQPFTFYVATASGGLWKTTNNGTTFTPIFDNQSVISIGDIAVAPSAPDVVWVGTGEANNSRSSYWGDGVYKSENGGKTWKHMGLKESHHVGRIVIHPENADIVYVAALGHLYSFNEERGLYKTTDGGQTWEKILFVSEKTGVVDVAMDPTNSDILFAASYDKQRLP
ncbi:MAG: glycosyl hydrolase, partial [Candidatus Aenigmarchaeota archaeon]|nr:glycosyl hydrolase [Candidatus Aenigmarchaeota archaeon]